MNEPKYQVDIVVRGEGKVYTFKMDAEDFRYHVEAPAVDPNPFRIIPEPTPEALVFRVKPVANPDGVYLQLDVK